VAAAVIGGTIVAVIYNGLQLLGLGAAQSMWTAGILLAAVTVARRGSSTTA
jgi:ABC-type xylose transport system permease subunit